MINAKRLIAMVRRWQKLAAMGRKRISMSRTNGMAKEGACRPLADKGKFVVYTSDGRSFAVPLAYLNSSIFRMLLKMSEDEYGWPSYWPITLPCDAVFMNYVVSLIQSAMPASVEKAVLLSMANGRCSTPSCLPQLQSNQSVLVHGC